MRVTDLLPQKNASMHLTLHGVLRVKKCAHENGDIVPRIVGLCKFS